MNDIDKVAEAIYLEDHHPSWPQILPWENLSSYWHSLYRRMARAAIAIGRSDD